MRNKTLIFLLIIVTVFFVDQLIKYAFVHGFSWESACISLVLHYNQGVAFSMFASLGESLKWIQLLLIGGIIFYIFQGGYLVNYFFPAGILVGAAASNLLDRFMHGGVVDYVYWHCGFDFAVFNLADAMIDLAIVIFLFQIYVLEKRES